MTRLKFVTLGLIGCALGFAGNLEVNKISGTSGSTKTFEVAVSKAYAAKKRKRARRTKRQTKRRNKRIRRRARHVRRARLPGGCAWRAPYHYCGGIYYQPVVESGTTVAYVVVYP